MLDFVGAARGIRTPDPIITNDALYSLSEDGFLKQLACRARLAFGCRLLPRGSRVVGQTSPAAFEKPSAPSATASSSRHSSAASQVIIWLN